MSVPSVPDNRTKTVIADVRIGFWRAVGILVKWGLAAIPAALIISIVVAAIVLAAVTVMVDFFGMRPPRMPF